MASLLIAVLALLLLLPSTAPAADTNILLPTGQRIDAWDLTGGGGATVLRQRFQITGASLADVAPVDPQAGLYVNLRKDDGTEIGTSTTPLVASLKNEAADNAANSSIKVPVLAGRAMASNPSWTDTNMAPLRLDPSTGSVYAIAPENGLNRTAIISGASTNLTTVKGSAGTVYSFCATNTNASPRYLRFYDESAAVTVGTTTTKGGAPFLIPGSTAGGGVCHRIVDGENFANAIKFSLTTGVSNSDTGAVSANEHTVHVWYR